MRSFFIVTVLCLLVSSLVATDSVSLWGENGIPLRQGGNIEWARSAATTTDGAVVYVWSDTRRGDRDVWAQKVDSTGNMVWGNDPILVNGKENRQEDPVIIGTTDGGVIIAWIDFRNEYDGDVYAQKLNANGDLLWGGATDIEKQNGMPVCLTTGMQISLNIVRDDNGGAYLIWVDKRNSNADIYGVHFDADGTDLWLTDGGTAVASGEGDQASHSFWEDGYNGAVMVYVNSHLGDKNIHASRLSSDGFHWTDIVLCDEAEDQEQPKVRQVADTLYAFAWKDKRTVGNRGDIYAQLVNLDGDIIWTDHPDGKMIYQDEHEQSKPQIEASSEFNGSFFAAWNDQRLFIHDYHDLFAQKVAIDGSLLWDADAVKLTEQENHQQNARMAADDNGGCFVVWDDGRNGGHHHEEIYIQHISSDGTLLWDTATDGKIVCAEPGEQYAAQIRKSGNNIFVNWGDKRNGSSGIYYQVISTDGTFQLEASGKLIFWALDGDAKNYATARSTNSEIFMVWEDSRRNTEKLYYQKVNANGDIGFATNGVALTPTMVVDQKELNLSECQEGGFTVTWSQVDGSFAKIYAQKVNADGAIQWTDPALALSTRSRSQKFPQITQMDDGFLVVWSNSIGTAFRSRYQVCLQKVDNSGNILWGDEGIQLTDANQDQTVECLFEDYVTWRDDSDIYMYRIATDGSEHPDWAPDGAITLCNADQIQRNTKITKVGDELLVTWKDKRSGDDSVYGQLLDLNGNIQWAANGLPLGDAIEDQLGESVAFDNNEIYVAWSDFRNGDDQNITMQKFGRDGTPVWTSDLIVTPKDSLQQACQIVNFSTGKFIVWEDYACESSDIRCQLVDNDGNLQWTGGTEGDSAMCTVDMQQNDPMVVKFDNERNSQALVVWSDRRSSGKEPIYGIYMQKIEVGVPVATSAHTVAYKDCVLNQNFPNPFNPETKISFSLANPQKVSLDIYNIKGQKVKTLVDNQILSGKHNVTWKGDSNSAKKVGSGVYFYKLSTPSGSIHKKMVLLK